MSQASAGLGGQTDGQMDAGRNGQLDGQMDVRRLDRRTQGWQHGECRAVRGGQTDRCRVGWTEGQLQLSVGATGWGGGRTPHTHPAQLGGPPIHTGAGSALPRGDCGDSAPPGCPWHRGDNATMVTPCVSPPALTATPSCPYCHLSPTGPGTPPRGLRVALRGTPSTLGVPGVNPTHPNTQTTTWGHFGV